MKERLLQTAGKLLAPPDKAIREFSLIKYTLAAEGSAALARRPDIEALVGKGNQQMAEDNNRNFAKFMESLFMNFNAEILVDTALWVFKTYRSHGFSTSYWDVNLNLWVDMLQTGLSGDAFDQISPFYNWLIVNIPVLTDLSDEAVLNPPPMPAH